MRLECITSKLLNRAGLALGTAARPSTPSGKRTLFVRNKKGEHWPAIDYFRMRLGLTPKEGIRFLVSPADFRSILTDADPEIGWEELEQLKTLPIAWREEAYQRHQFLVAGLVACATKGVVWDEYGARIFEFKMEEGSRTVFLHFGTTTHLNGT